MINRRALLALSLGGGLAACTSPRPPTGPLDVRQFGAAGDGSGDDGPAIQAAIDSGAPVLSFPPGRYQIARPLIPRSHQSWRGAGAGQSILAQPRHSPPPAFNLVEQHQGLEAVEFRDLGFLGNSEAGPAAIADGQHGFALYLRGAIADLTLADCRFADFGDGGQGGGGVILGPVPGTPTSPPGTSNPSGAPGQGLSHITVTGCRFEINGNVPGLYLGAGDQPGSRRHTILITGNRFAGSRGKRVQNCLYILGTGPESRISAVAVENNIFDLETPIDAAIELNWVETFALTGNLIRFAAGLDGSAGILIRDGCRAGTIAGNSLSDHTGGREIGGILLLNFADPAIIENIAITGNSLDGFTWRGIACDRGSRGITVTGNRLSHGVLPIREAIRVVGGQDILLGQNAISGAIHPVLLAGTGSSQVAGVTIDGNLFDQCGGNHGLIDVGAAADLTDLVIRGNQVRRPKPGTEALITGLIEPAQAVIRDNLTAGLPVLAS